MVQVVRRTGSRDVPAAGRFDVRAGLQRWATQLTRRRAAVLARRYLLVGLLVALVSAIVVLVLGASRPFWALAALVIAPIAAVVSLTQPTPDAKVARLVDRALGLHEQLGTALELQAESAPSTGLAGMVVQDASTALAQSFHVAHARARRAPAEWAWVAVAAAALAVVIALPRHASTNSGPGGRSVLAARPQGGGSPQQPQSGSTQAVSHTTPLASRGTSSTPAVSQVPLTGGAKAAFGQQGTSTAGSRSPASANGAGTVEGHGTKPGLAVSGHKNAAGGRQSGSSQSASQAGAHAGTPGITTGVSASTTNVGKAGASPTAKPSSGAQGAHSGVTSTTPGKTAGASAAAQKGRNSGGTPAGGTAGTGKAAAHAKLGLAPYGGAGTGTTALPLQATYTPGSTSHLTVKGGASTTANGTGNGQGGSRSGHPGSGSTTSAGSGTNFSVIPPTANPSSPDQDLALNYFGMTNQLTFKGW